jgi:hypothetical protein
MGTRKRAQEIEIVVWFVVGGTLGFASLWSVDGIVGLWTWGLELWTWGLELGALDLGNRSFDGVTYAGEIY